MAENKREENNEFPGKQPATVPHQRSQPRLEPKNSPASSILLAIMNLGEAFFQVLTMLIPVIALTVVFRNLNWQHLPIP
jgi:hypothetical protein